MISKRVAMMFSGYPQSDFTDPVGAALSMCSVFEDYADELIKFATDPKTGLQRRYKWPPKIAEVVEFCNERVTHSAKMERFKNWGKPDTPMLESPREEKPTLEELHAEWEMPHPRRPQPRRAPRKGEWQLPRWLLDAGSRGGAQIHPVAGQGHLGG